MTEQRITLLITSLWVALTVSSWGQSTNVSVRQYEESRGISSQVVWSMLQDRQGFMWFGTPDGLNRFDGHTFITFRNNPEDSTSIAANFITALSEDHDGNIWIGYYSGGISCYNPGKGRFTNYPLINVNGQNLGGPEVVMLHTDVHNQIWIGVRGEGIVQLNPRSGQMIRHHIISPTESPYSPDTRKAYNTAYRIYESARGLFYLATQDGLYSFDRITRRMRAIRKKSAGVNELRDDSFRSIVADGDVLWLGAWAGGLSSYDTKSGQWQTFHFDQRRLSTTNIVTSIVPQGRDSLLISSIDRGLGYFDKRTSTFSFITDNAALPKGQIWRVLCDRSGTLWLNLETGLLSVRKQPKKFIFVPVKVTQSDNPYGPRINRIFENNHFQLIGSHYGDGLQVFNKQTGQRTHLSIHTSLGEPLQLVTDIYQDTKENIWVVTRDFLYLFDQKAVKLIKIKQPPIWTKERPSNYFSCIQEDKQGAIWLGTVHNGLFCYDPQRQLYTHYAPATPKPLGTRSILAISIDKQGRVWVGGKQGYLAYFDHTQQQFKSVPLTHANRTANEVVALSGTEDGFMYAGTDVGLFTYACQKKQPSVVRLYTALNGLKGDIVLAINRDEFGKIWCVTETALCAVDPKTGHIDHYGPRDGIMQPNISNTLDRLPGGLMALTTTGGYYQFQPAAFQPRVQQIAPVITSFQVNHHECYYQDELDQQGYVRLKPNESTCSFEFALLDYQEADLYQYSYKLDGLDADWVDAGSRRYAGYTNLPGGNYTFRVRAINQPGNLNVPELAIPLYVETVFYATWWFRIGLLLLVIGGSYAYYRHQLRANQQLYQLQTKANALEKEKALVMYESLKQQLNPHFLFNSLTSLSSLIRVDQKLAGQFLDSLSKMYRYILKNRDTELVTLADELRYVQMYINLQKTRFGEGLQVTIQAEDTYTDCKIVPVTVQNLLENAIKHNVVTVDQPLCVSIYTDQGYLLVSNNLQKKKFVETSNRQGLANLLSFYRYLSDKPVHIEETTQSFAVKIPLL